MPVQQPAEVVKPSTAFLDNDYCFACGSRNPLGLHLSFVQRVDCFETRVLPAPHWQGWQGVMHGGLQATIMDDLMSNHLFKVCRVHVVTAELQARFRQPVPLDRELIFTSRIEGQQGRLWLMSATCAAAQSPETVLTTGSGRFMQVPGPQ
jgi:acyl-coenzyme A thioesterase PaaI-like protein